MSSHSLAPNTTRCCWQHARSQTKSTPRTCQIQNVFVQPCGYI